MTAQKLREICKSSAAVMRVGEACCNASFYASRNDRHASKLFQDAIAGTIALSIHNVLKELEKENNE